MMGTNEYDTTKRMLETMRAGGKLMTESIENSKNQDVIEVTGDEKKAEEQKFREILGNLVEFTTFKIYPKVRNVVFGGHFQGMGGLQFQMSLEDSNGIYITAEQMQLTPEVVETVKKLRSYYDNWKEEWGDKLATEYKIGE